MADCLSHRVGVRSLDAGRQSPGDVTRRAIRPKALQACILLASFAQAAVSVAATTPWTSSGVLVTDQRIDTIKARIQAGYQPTVNYYNALMKGVAVWKTDAIQAPTAYVVPSFYSNQAASRAAKVGLVHDTTAAYGLALAYRLTGDESYAAASAKYLNAWRNIGFQNYSTAEDSQLTFSYTFPGMIYAADLLSKSNSWSPADQSAFKSFVPAIATRMTTAGSANNWGDWGNLLNIASAAYTSDRAKYDTAVARYKAFIADQIDSNGFMKYEITRNTNGDQGISYSHFAIGPLAMTAEIARVNGDNLYDYTSSNGHTLKQAWDNVAAWTQDPTKFVKAMTAFKATDPSNMVNVIFTDYDYLNVNQTGLKAVRNGYFELLQARWASTAAGQVISTMQPTGTDVAAMQFLGLTHGSLSSDVGTVPEPAALEGLLLLPFVLQRRRRTDRMGQPTDAI